MGAKRDKIKGFGVAINPVGKIQRLRYFRGHNVHSPFVYRLVREVFMERRSVDYPLENSDVERHGFLQELSKAGVDKRTARELYDLKTVCGVGWRVVNPHDSQLTEGLNVVLARGAQTVGIEKILGDVESWEARSEEGNAEGCTILAVVAPPRHYAEHKACRRTAVGRFCLSVDRGRYFVFFMSKKYQKQYFKL